MTKKILILVVLFLAALGISYIVFTYVLPIKKAIVITPPEKLVTGGVGFDESLPKTQPCPLNGTLYSTQQQAWWQQHAPLGIMVENSTDARPQSGLSNADIVYEAVAEGGITRFLGIFYCQDAKEVAPVRSARVYYVNWVSEYGPFPLYAHVGGANTPGPADALGLISSLGWDGYNDLNQFAIGFPTYWRDYNRLGHDVATEHTMVTTTTKLWDFAKTRGLTNVDKDGTAWDSKFIKYTFKDDAAISSRPVGQAIHIDFSSDSNYSVDWTYDKANNLYKRNNGGQPQIDLNTKKQLTAKNVVVLFMPLSQVDDGYMNNEHMEYGNVGNGKALIFVDGKETIGTWKKASRTARTLIFDNTGSPVVFDRGTIWFEAQPLDGDVSVK
ncbi:MAG TPA: DUF3048 domain-containing protein [Patescibacteria group bacterium]|nr:DUF3048 domain-containing protein [Patescibacteria group bacterium]